MALLVMQLRKNIRAETSPSPQTDIFGLGVILFQMLTKYDPTVKPFSFPSMNSLNPEISGKLTDIIMRAIQLEPVKRYISMS